MNMLAFYRTTVGKKFVVAASGLFLLFFVFGHMAGNLKVFAGQSAEGVYKIDHYAEFLRTFASDILGEAGFLWIFRALLLIAVVLHIVTIIQLRRINKKARPLNYKKKKGNMSSFVVDMMFYGGLVLAFFIVFHILHLTVGTLHYDFEHGAVYSNLYSAFKNPIITIFYVISVGFLGMHLYHGIWSVGQTLGINSAKTNDMFQVAAKVLSVVITLGFAAVPVAILTGLLSAPH